MHNPPWSFGDCHRTAIACLLDLDRDQVPNWAEANWHDAAAFNRACDEWLERRYKLRQFHLAYNSELQQVLDTMQTVNPGAVYLLCGTSANGHAHTVVAGRGRILCDPSTNDAGIVSAIDGCYWVTLLVPVVHFPAKIQAPKQQHADHDNDND